MKHNRLIVYLIALFLASGLCACSREVVKTEQPVMSTWVTQDREHAIGQSFTARYAGLRGVRLTFDPLSNTGSEILLHLRNSPSNSIDIETSATIPISHSNPTEYAFRFSPIRDSLGHDYFFELETRGDDQLLLAAGPAESYLHGALYANKTPQESQLRFELLYDPFLLVLGIFQEILNWTRWSVLALVLFTIPGWAILRFFLPGWESLLWMEKIALASGVNIAIYPVVFLWSHLAGLQPGPLIASAAALLSFVVIAWEARQLIVQGRLKAFLQKKSFNPPLYEGVLIAVLLLIAATRYWAVRTLDTPLWGDGYQHTMITQLLVDHKGLFDSWLPYAELSTFTYHFGFHNASALFHWISGLSTPESTLLTGQILNSLAVLGLYPLCLRVINNRWAALASILFAGLFFSMPMYYINWGRYSQLSGLVVLPPLIYLLWRTLENPKLDKHMLFLNGVVMCGLALSHYRVLIIALLFIPAWFVLNFRSVDPRLSVKKIFWIGVIGSLLTLPWLVQVFSGKLHTIVGGQVAAPVGELSDLSLVLGSLSSYLPPLAWFSLPALIIWGFLKREKNLILIWVWWLLVFLFANPQLFGLPGSGIMTNFAVFISAYIPASITLGCGIGWFSDWLGLRVSKSILVVNPTSRLLLSGLICMLLLGFSFYGAKNRLPDLQVSKHILVTRPDLRAARWIQSNLPEGARLLINSFFAYNGTAVVGSDGGWWLPLIAGRLTSLPPLNYVSEQGLEPNFYQSTNDLTALIEAKGLNDPEVLDELDRRGLTHVYIGQLQGSVNSERPLIDPDELQNSPYYLPVYHQDRVWVFEVVH